MDTIEFMAWLVALPAAYAAIVEVIDRMGVL